MLSAICPLKLQKLAKKQNNLIIVSCCNLACLRRLMHFLITCKRAFAQFNSRTGPQKRSLPVYPPMHEQKALSVLHLSHTV